MRNSVSPFHGHEGVHVAGHGCVLVFEHQGVDAVRELFRDDTHSSKLLGLRERLLDGVTDVCDHQHGAVLTELDLVALRVSRLSVFESLAHARLDQVEGLAAEEHLPDLRS